MNTLPRTILAPLLALATAAPTAALDGSVFLEAGAKGVREDILVPLVFSGPSLGLGASLGWEGLGARHEARGRFAAAYLTNRYGHEATHFDEELSWRLDWPVGGPRSDALRLGTGIDSRSRLSYLFSWDDAHAYWIGSLAIPASIRRRLEIRGWTGSVRLSAAMFALESRPPGYYRTKQQPLKDPRFLFDRQFSGLEPAAPWDHLDLDLEAWIRPPSSRWELGALTGLVRASEPEQAFVLDAALRIGYHWGGAR